MREEKIELTTICARLERAIHADVGMDGLNLLLWWWRWKCGFISQQTLRNRKKQSGFEWLTLSETAALSSFAGYDLTKD
jgi:hypothetical protein